MGLIVPAAFHYVDMLISHLNAVIAVAAPTMVGWPGT
jgi:hypothetical protein